MRKLRRAVLALLAFGFGYSAFIYLTLPDVRSLRTSNPETTAFIELRAREARARGEQPKRIQRWAPLLAHFVQPQASRCWSPKTRAFWKHEGIDFDELKESIEINLERMEFARGGSTITQQLAKNLYPLAVEESGPEAARAPDRAPARGGALEAAHPRAVSERRSNGATAFTAPRPLRAPISASRPAALAAAESALLAAAISNPRLLNPAHPTPRLRRRQQMVMRRMGAVTPPPVVAGPASAADPPAAARG